jgi:hypothetical protein
MKRKEVRNAIRIRTTPRNVDGHQTVIGEVTFGVSVIADVRASGAMAIATEEIKRRIEERLFNETGEEIMELIWELKGDIALECRAMRKIIFKKLDRIVDLIAGREEETEMEDGE